MLEQVQKPNSPYHVVTKKKHVSTTVDHEIAEVIAQRAASLGKTRGSYVREIITSWYSEGAKPIDELDAWAISRQETGTGTSDK